MFGLFNKKPRGETITLSIDGMHCVSCSMNIDGTLEDLGGVIESKTNYASGKTIIVYDPKTFSLEKSRKAIEALGYSVS
ncbi:MAG TPA: hypothetical protein DCX25_00740 [Candidatus Pacebacteria bacterium]|nr:MAG: hypothetical protein UX00_C0003G0131 [Microgenomates group bacterium GW2011_GWB1_45_17]KKU23187.1 MAG: hypothetical protein UX35_C0009G0011 [Microgenomates group bacterium GW2011_GWA1_46_15]KKU24065.1 MAG: hypothetical protein UX36_C0002G0048 [Microgenomates group bacterium GW2011_GWC1_46_15]HAV14846.1 hypothetical protein [Candidatus Paceibacterota bacterium]HCR11237.1 hypothetical protein [Candidatus Paceibacterota bacterium]